MAKRSYNQYRYGPNAKLTRREDTYGTQHFDSAAFDKEHWINDKAIFSKPI